MIIKAHDYMTSCGLNHTQEYGITKDEKLNIAHKICKPILSKIQADFQHTIVNEQGDILHRLDHRLSKGVVSPKRHVRTRLYFTSESHVHSLTNILKHDNLIEVLVLDINMTGHLMFCVFYRPFFIVLFLLFFV